MATYNTYQEAKIAMPNACIIEDTDSGLFFGMPTREGTTLAAGSRFAEPRYYCITVEKFLADGYKFVDGDLHEYLGTVITASSNSAFNNSKALTDNKRFILRAAALEKPFLQTGESFEHSKALNIIRDRLNNSLCANESYDYMHKLNNAIAFVERMENKKATCDDGELIEKLFDGFNRITAEREYENAYDIACEMLELEGKLTSEQEKPRRTKVEWGCVHYSEVVHYFDIAGSDLYYFPSSNAGKCNSLQDYIDNLQDDGDPCLYHRIETEITERDEFIGEVCAINEKTHGERRQYLVESLFDSGRVKLIN